MAALKYLGLPLEAFEAGYRLLSHPDLRRAGRGGCLADAAAMRGCTGCHERGDVAVCRVGRGSSADGPSSVDVVAGAYHASVDNDKEEELVTESNGTMTAPP